MNANEKKAIMIALENWSPKKVVAMFDFDLKDVMEVKNLLSTKTDMIHRDIVKAALTMRDKGIKYKEIVKILSIKPQQYFYIVKHYNLDNFKKE